MKNTSKLLLVALLTFSTAATTVAAPNDSGDDDVAIAKLEQAASAAVSSAQWATFGERLTDALSSGHDAIQQAAMRMVIRYGENVDVRKGVFDVMRVYRDGDDEALRRMAVVTLANMKSDWALKFLDRSLRFEDSLCVRKTIRAVLNEANLS